MSRWVMPRLMASRSGGHRIFESSFLIGSMKKHVCDPEDSGLRTQGAARHETASL